MFRIYFIATFLSICTLYIACNPIPIKLDAVQGNKENLEFAVQLPNNDTVQIDLSFKLLTFSKPLDDSLVNKTDESITTTTLKPKPNFVTVREAIEGFRQDLIKKEKDIAGIIESNHPFYRHFKLQFQDDIELSIRCTYDSSYEKRTLSINCYEYREYETERILSNGEIELIRMQDMDYKSDVEFIDARNVKQIYAMEIS